MIYDYLLTIYNLFVGLLSGKSLVNIAIIAIVLFVVWAAVALLLSFAARFAKRSAALVKFVKESEATPENLDKVIEDSNGISKGLEMGLKRFKNSGGLASDHVFKHEALDSEFNRGTFNHGKSLMKAYIWVCTAIIFMFNLGLLASTSELTGELFAKAMMLPLVFYIIVKVFYFIYASIQQQFYSLSEDSFYELVGLLDEKFGKRQAPVQVVAAEPSDPVSPQEDEMTAGEAEEEKLPEDDEATEEKEAPEKPEKTLDDYDFFKKKNIDVDKLAGEVPASSNLPYIDVDSDYVIKDDESPANSYHPNAQNGGEVLGGMMHAVKKEEKEEVASKPEEEPKESEDSGTQAEEPNTSKEGKPGSLEEFKVEEVESDDSAEGGDNPPEATDAVSTDESDTPASDASAEQVEAQTEDAENSESESDLVQNSVESNFENFEDAQTEEGTDESFENESTDENFENEEHIANLVGRFKPKSKLASGGVVIERNDASMPRNDGHYSKTHEVQVLDTVDDEQGIINSMRNTQTFDGDEPVYGQGGQYVQSPDVVYNTGYGQNYYGGNMDTNFMGFGGYPDGGLPPEYQGHGGYGQFVGPNENYVAPRPAERQTRKVEKNPPLRPRTPRTPKSQVVPAEEPKTPVATEEPKRQTRAKRPAEAKPEASETKSDAGAKRGRPAKQVFDDGVTIADDSEFEKVLSRAEKLMRKSEEALSPSQSKRVEKELKTLLDAMKRYKEGK